MRVDRHSKIDSGIKMTKHWAILVWHRRFQEKWGRKICNKIKGGLSIDY